MGSLAGNLLQATRCWYWRLELAVPPARRRRVLRARGRAPRARDLRERLLRVGASVRRRRRAARARRDAAHDRRELPLAELYRVPTEDDRRTTTLEPGELILEVELPEVEASVYLKAMERKRWAFPLVGVAAARSRRRDAGRARRRRADPVAPRRARSTRRRRCRGTRTRSTSRRRSSSAPKRRSTRRLTRARLLRPMGRETQRRLALLAVVGVARRRPGRSRCNRAARDARSRSPRRPARRSPVAAMHACAPCPFPTSLRPAFEVAARDASLPLALLYAVAQGRVEPARRRASRRPARAACCR